MIDFPESLMNVAEAASTNSWTHELESAGAGRAVAIAMLRALYQYGLDCANDAIPVWKFDEWADVLERES